MEITEKDKTGFIPADKPPEDERTVLVIARNRYFEFYHVAQYGDILFTDEPRRVWRFVGFGGFGVCIPPGDVKVMAWKEIDDV